MRGDGEGAMNTLFALHARALSGDAGAVAVGVVGLLTVLLAANRAGVVVAGGADPGRGSAGRSGSRAGAGGGG